jgi:hypothetical protein
MIKVLGNTFRERVEAPLILPVAGAERAPNLIAAGRCQSTIFQWQDVFWRCCSIARGAGSEQDQNENQGIDGSAHVTGSQE